MTSRNRDGWYIFDGSDTDRTSHELNIEKWRMLPEPPPWRRFDGLDQERARSFLPEPEDIERVNAALYLRRPLLITGKPGSGKTTLVYAVARELGLGQVLRWSITSRSSLQDGLYHYDAVARLQDTHLDEQAARRQAAKPEGTGVGVEELPGESRDVGRYLTLGPLGTAFFARGPVRVEARQRYFPRVLLIDEIDKSDIDLPNDLLHVFEEGRFQIPELVRLKERQNPVDVRAWGVDAGTNTVRDGEVPCLEFPLVIMTSNGEREFPPAFLRRCLQLHMEPPGRDKLEKIVRSHLFPLRRGADAAERQRCEREFDARKAQIDALIGEFLRLRDTDRKELATDQLMNAICLAMSDVDLTPLIGAEDCGVLSAVFSP